MGHQAHIAQIRRRSDHNPRHCPLPTASFLVASIGELCGYPFTHRRSSIAESPGAQKQTPSYGVNRGIVATVLVGTLRGERKSLVAPESQLPELIARFDMGVEVGALGVCLHEFLKYPRLDLIVDVRFARFQEPNVKL